ncbi:hypothetical protein [Rugosimonospora africana]|uniref:Uncharacterized protein n=1 Tax=Rugosimonospora africana TaxID=556532 RepID=A0A8J3VW41_9ACTN|nr:hypothetical protein [Rugosimonospora africana]GIH20426.1 hypothetical protein Raf01_85980 [Rugosimonospora africana]
MLAAAPVDGWAVLGPVTGTGRAGCWWCAAVRLGIDPARPADPTGASTPTVARMIGGALAFAAFGELTAASLGKRLAVVQQLRTLEATRLKVDGGCPVYHGHPADNGGTPPVRRAAKGEPVVRIVADMPAGTVREYSAAVHRLVRNRPAPADFDPD